MRTPTSATPSRRRPARRRRDAAGFTLVELLVVFAIVALMAAVVPLAFDRLRESAQYRQTVRAVLADLRTARHRAVAEGSEVRFTVDLAGRTYALQGRSPQPLPASVEVKATVATIELSPEQVAAIRFLPSGGSTGGAIDVVRPNGAGARLQVDWLSGRVTQIPLVP